MGLLSFLNSINLFKNLEYPYLLLLIIPLAVFSFYILRKDFIKLKEDEDVRRRRVLVQKIVIVSRCLIFLLLLIAIATPYVHQEKTLQGDTRLKILVDNTTSMQLIEQLPNNFFEEIKKKVETEIISVGFREKSDIGDAVLSNLGPFESVLLITDGNVNEGSSLSDVALYAKKLNSTINAVALNTIRDDVAVSVIGPAKVMDSVENTFTVHLSKAGKIAQVPITVLVDDKVVLEKTTDKEYLEFKQKMDEGFHRIVVKANVNDYFPQNNIFYKTVKSVTKPKLLYYSTKSTSPILTLLRQVFEVETTATLPSGTDLKNALKDFYAIIVNDVSSKDIEDKAAIIDEYLIDGNGMLVIGGENSFNNGRYKNTVFEDLLPVIVGKPGKKPGDVNIVIVIDISGSTGSAFGAGKAVDVEKMLALTVVDSIEPTNYIAVIAFNTEARPVVVPLKQLFEHKNIKDRIASLVDGGGTRIHAGLLFAHSLLQAGSGSKNVILISDGKQREESLAIEASKLLANDGIKIFTVGVGEKTNEDLMIKMADLSNGIYFRATDASRVKILFGEFEESKQGEKPGLFILNKAHFITQGLDEIKATVSGFNQVAPKTAARLLVTTSNGEPILTVWRRGLGRVAALSTDDGTNWAGDLLGRDASVMITRTVNWIIGEPDRKEKENVNVQDTVVFQPTDLIVKSQNQPTSKDHSFFKIDENNYITTITPIKTGFQEVLGAVFASNYPTEYVEVGMNPQLKSIVEVTGGKMFSKTDYSGMASHVVTRSKRIISINSPLRWPFIALAIIIFLVEIFIRRYLRKE